MIRSARQRKSNLPTVRQLHSELQRLRRRVEDLEDLRDLNAAINLAGWVHPAVAPSAGETENAWPRGGQTGPRPARPDPRVPAEACFGGWGDAGTGIAPEPADLIGGRIRQAGLTPAS